jgi:glycine/D-amino acid oxidase-like deaminating enzyme
VAVTIDSAAERLKSAAPTPFWLDDATAAPEPCGRLTGIAEADLVVVGGGFTGLWTALLAKERDPAREVVLLESERVGWAATGRNGGFCAASLTHGFLNGLHRWPAEMAALEKLGLANLDAIEETVIRYGITCDWRRSGRLRVAVQEWQLPELRGLPALAAGYGGAPMEWLDRDQVQAEVASPTYLGAVWDHGYAMVDPARLAWGLRRACVDLGVRIHEHSPVLGLSAWGGGVTARTGLGEVRARAAALATNAFPPLLRRIRHYIVPVYDYVLVTEPLTDDLLAEIGWRNRQGIGDQGNQFHYYRLTADNRILWGGYDAIYHFGNGLRPELDQRPATFVKLVAHFQRTFPQLREVRFTHAWGGAIDTCSRFTPFWGRAMGGRVAYVAGFTGLGVGSSRFGAGVMLDLLDGRDSEATRLRMVRSKPVPFPPEPLRYGVIQATRRSIDRADRNGGRRDAWLRTLDALGLGFNS